MRKRPPASLLPVTCLSVPADAAHNADGPGGGNEFLPALSWFRRHSTLGAGDSFRRKAGASGRVVQRDAITRKGGMFTSAWTPAAKGPAFLIAVISP